MCQYLDIDTVVKESPGGHSVHHICGDQKSSKAQRHDSIHQNPGFFMGIFSHKKDRRPFLSLDRALIIGYGKL